ncbi:hypothetical protein ASPWEDRAFT_37183 [Aspergillus wentii DTO 134E9]|uniref:Uncharacterized protein n=1 Tax=Aspergillus wentii DTO 134E9 TaxID=1073089 RepID=A0A1L9RWV1_ASPWE|nr:uncharacterized protein ASPWEDRAFT_37183 [Aspergillus wentii DTO 134E9]OJJ39402.1 hypothetical protein ASPWEDRAFT_37183 [Aspergillus wentii DTO 134E9]
MTVSLAGTWVGSDSLKNATIILLTVYNVLHSVLITGTVGLVDNNNPFSEVWLLVTVDWILFSISVQVTPQATRHVVLFPHWDLISQSRED